jgi:hypothetical protein
MSLEPVTQRAVHGFDRQNSFLRALLGLCSQLERFDKIVAQHGQPSHSEPGPLDAPLYALLGALKLRLDLERVFASALNTPESTEEPLRQQQPRIPRSVLR